jgi:hypothetical protein
MDDANPKKRKPLTSRQQLRNILDALAEDVLTDKPSKKTPPKRERMETEELRAKLIKRAEEYGAELDRKAAEPEWGKRAKKKAPPGSGHVM